MARREYAGVGVRSGSGVVLLSYLRCFLPCLVDPLLLDVTRGPSKMDEFSEKFRILIMLLLSLADILTENT